MAASGYNAAPVSGTGEPLRRTGYGAFVGLGENVGAIAFSNVANVASGSSPVSCTLISTSRLRLETREARCLPRALKAGAGAPFGPRQ